MQRKESICIMKGKRIKEHLKALIKSA